MKDAFGLNARQRAFVLTYVATPDAAKAAIAAGYSRKTAKMCGYALLNLPRVRAEVERLQAAAFAKAGLSIETTLEQLRRLLLFQPQSIFDDNGAVRPVKDWPAEALSALCSIETKELYDDDGRAIGRVNKVKMSPRVDAISLAMKHYGLLIERHEIHQTIEHRVADMSPEAREILLAEILDKTRLIDATPDG